MKGIFQFVFMTVFLTCMCSCGDEKNDASQHPEKSFSKSIDSLKKFIDLKTYAPVNVMWKYSSLSNYTDSRITVPGPTDHVLEAFIQFDRKTADKLKNDTKDSVKRIILTQPYIFEWLPKDLIIKEKIDSSRVYNARPFTKAPLFQGSYLFLNSTTILLTVGTQ